MLQFALPLSDAVFRGRKQVIPACPTRLDVQVLKGSAWGRVPQQSLEIHTIRMGNRGYSMLCNNPG